MGVREERQMERRRLGFHCRRRSLPPPPPVALDWASPVRPSLRSNSILDHLGSGSGAPSAVGQEYQLGTRRLRVLRQLGEGGERPLLT